MTQEKESDIKKSEKQKRKDIDDGLHKYGNNLYNKVYGTPETLLTDHEGKIGLYKSQTVFCPKIECPYHKASDLSLSIDYNLEEFESEIDFQELIGYNMNEDVQNSVQSEKAPVKTLRGQFQEFLKTSRYNCCQ